jgi:hypothetical protein
MSDLEAVNALIREVGRAFPKEDLRGLVQITQLTVLTSISRNLALLANPVKTIPSELAIRELLDICGEVYAVSEGHGVISPTQRARLNSACAKVEAPKPRLTEPGVAKVWEDALKKIARFMTHKEWRENNPVPAHSSIDRLDQAIFIARQAVGEGNW